MNWYTTVTSTFFYIFSFKFNLNCLCMRNIMTFQSHMFSLNVFFSKNTSWAMNYDVIADLVPSRVEGEILFSCKERSKESSIYKVKVEFLTGNLISILFPTFWQWNNNCHSVTIWPCFTGSNFNYCKSGW